MSCFKAYDIRGRVPDTLNSDIAYRIGLSYARRYLPECVALGRDVRHSSRSLLEALALGLNEGGVKTLDLGLCGTEEVYFAAFQPGVEGGIMVTGSHNPADYNGMKLVLAGARPISGDTGLRELETDVNRLDIGPHSRPDLRPTNFRPAYVDHLLGYVRQRSLAPLTIVANAGNGPAGLVVDALAPLLPFQFVRVHFEPDGDFPNGIPNPLLPECRSETSQAVIDHAADFGIAWDGDFDRCFFFDENGRFIEGYYIVGLLAEAMLQQAPGSKIIHDPRLTWNTVDMVRNAGGVPVQSKTGHAYIKERMRSEDALYGGEMSAHHYFRDFSYCDNGNIPWLLVAALISEKGKPLSELVNERMRMFPASGEINRQVASTDAVLDAVRQHYAGKAVKEETVDGLSLEFDAWRFNLRASNTEPLLRLNVESRGDEVLMQSKTGELLAFIDRVGQS